MKVLIVDDNGPVQRTLTETLSTEGFAVSAADSVNALETMASFKPDAVLLDSSVENFQYLIDTLGSKGNVVNVIVMTDAEGSDSPFITGYIKKPFDITEVIERLKELPDTKEKPKRSILRSIFGKRTEVTDHPEPKHGRSYLLIENEPDNAYSMTSRLAEEGCQILILTSGKIRAASERIGHDAKIIALSGKEGQDHIEPEKMGTLMGLITDFTSLNERPAVLLDDLDLLIEKNDKNSVVTMIYQIVCGSERAMTLIISMRSGEITEKDRELLQNNMEIHTFR